MLQDVLIFLPDVNNTHLAELHERLAVFYAELIKDNVVDKYGGEPRVFSDWGKIL